MSLYSQYFFQQEKKIPTPISIIVVLLAVLVMFRLFNSSPTLTKASKKSLKEIKIVNINSAGATVIWETEDQTVSWITYGNSEAGLLQTAIDERDLSNKKEKRKLHFADLKGLNASSNYYFKIVTEKELIGNTEGKAFNFKTLASPLADSNLTPLYGKIVNVDGVGLSGAVVTLSVDGNPSLAVLTKETGEWLIVPKFERILPAGKIVQVEISEETGKHTLISASLKNLSPLPQTVIIGQDYDFSKNVNNVLSAKTQITDKNPARIDIIFPKEGMVIPGNNPLIKGIALPDREVIVYLRSPATYSFRVKADMSGQWSILVPEALNVGEHQITAITKDNQNKEITLVRKFYIAKSGEQVLGDATGSATPTLAPIVTMTPLPTTYSYSSSPVPTAPVSGGNIKTLSVLSGSLIIVGLGIMLAF